MTGLRAELSISAVESCPVAALSADSEEQLSDVTWTADGADSTVERFDTQSGEAGIDDEAARDTSPDTVFDDGTTRTMEFEREWDDCVCEQIESVGCPVDDVRAVDGRLLVQFRVRSNERLREVIAAARTVADDVRLNYVVSAGDDRTDAVLIDRGELTDRQREVLETAYSEGYFAHPRETNAETVAESLDISASTFREHLATAQSKLLGSALAE
ncbi:MAG: helix-turn-helix domain-containing protein [Halobaculum sp.]